jgi:4-carboxymuconolactone decarboxylase
MLGEQRIIGIHHPELLMLRALLLIAFAGLTSVAAAKVPAKPVAPQLMRDLTPDLARYTDEVLFGDVWQRPGLAPRDRSLVTVATLVATGKTGQLTGHLGRALDNGVSPSEIAGLLTHLAFYSGWPSSVSALEVTERVFRDRKVDTAPLRQMRKARPSSPKTAQPVRPGSIGAGAPKLAELTDRVLAEDLWRLPNLAVRDRSLITIAALTAGGDEEQLALHIRHGIRNGLSRKQIGEAITHLAFYAGWPKAILASKVAASAFDEATVGDAAKSGMSLVRPGERPSRGAPDKFTGVVTVSGSFEGDGGSSIGGATVRFEPAARSHWHSHPLGQTLIVTEGEGIVQTEGAPARKITPGDVIWTPPGVRHWHGASPNQGLTHVAVSEALDGRSVIWFERVSDQSYAAAN